MRRRQRDVVTLRQLGGTRGLAAIGTVIATLQGPRPDAVAVSSSTGAGHCVAGAVAAVAVVVALLVMEGGRQESEASLPSPAGARRSSWNASGRLGR